MSSPLAVLTAFVVIGSLLTSASPAIAQGLADPADEAVAYRSMARTIPLGSRVKVQVKGGKTLAATLLTTTDEGVVVKRETRVPEPAVTIAYGDLARLQRDERRGSLSLGKAIGIGLAAGVGAILTLFAIAVSISD